RILLLGDYSGRENLAQSVDSPLPEAKPIEVDRDNFDDLMKRLNVGLRLDLKGASGERINLQFRELDDFHPDRLFQQVSLFSELRDVRKRLLNPDSYDQAAREVREWLVIEAEDPPVQTDSAETDAQENSADPAPSSGNLLDDILGQTKTDASTNRLDSARGSLLGDFVRDVVKPYLVETDEAEQAQLLSLIDSSTGDLMRTILHHPEFKALEAAWRGLYFLIRRVETDSDLKISLLDISKEEVMSNLKTVEDLTDSHLYNVIIRDAVKTLGGEPWSLICGNYEFGLDVDQAATMIRLSKLANIAVAPFIAQIKPQMLGIDSFSEGSDERLWNYKDETTAGKLWTMLRTIPEASSLGLALPGFLGRLPYGASTDPTEVFDFEELAGNGEHHDYLWINPSFLVAGLVGQSFSSFGWELRSRMFLDVDGLPTHVYKSDGETMTKPCAEVVFTHSACDIIIEQGLMPLISFRDSDRVRLGGFQSISFPAKPLKGRWS
ncbi:MAG: type VI secretion system contractile sheath large subunit, partial [Acidobacteria bacterium]|nr:type VI secretion system contractile sheath large subunit [Acidobacteriota bacterium]